MNSPSIGAIPQSEPETAPRGGFRWTICALLFLAATINYVDRQVIGILKPTLQAQFGWNEIDYSNIVFAFQFAYAIGMMVTGGVTDRIGTKIGFALAVAIWSAAAIAHAAAPTIGPAVVPILTVVGLTYSGSVAGFLLVRFALGLGEAGSFPASIKAVAEWFPSRERAVATGIFNSGTNIGAVVGPLAVPWLTVRFGWAAAFIGTGVLGLVWLMLWWPLYGHPRQSRHVTAAELAYIESDPHEPTARVPWHRLLPHRQTWAFSMGKFMTDPIWWVYLYWIPDFLHRQYDIDLVSLALPLVVIYQFATIGSIGGGWLSSALLRRGWSLNRARKTAMLVCALAVVPIPLAALARHEWVAVCLVGLAVAAHQGWSCNLFTLTSDMFPREAVGSIVGFGGMWGSIGAMLIALVTGYVLQSTGSYVPIFIVASLAYLAALLIIHLLVPRLEPARI